VHSFAAPTTADEPELAHERTPEGAPELGAAVSAKRVLRVNTSAEAEPVPVDSPDITAPATSKKQFKSDEACGPAKEAEAGSAAAAVPLSEGATEAAPQVAASSGADASDHVDGTPPPPTTENSKSKTPADEEQLTHEKKDFDKMAAKGKAISAGA